MEHDGEVNMVGEAKGKRTQTQRSQGDVNGVIKRGEYGWRGKGKRTQTQRSQGDVNGVIKDEGRRERRAGEGRKDREEVETE